MATLAPWQGVTPVFLGRPQGTVVNNPTQTVKSEPSGLAIYTDASGKWIFMVSDNGLVSRAALPSSSAPTGQLAWKTNPTPSTSDKLYDYECVAFSTANGSLWVGVEGDSTATQNPLVQKFIPSDGNAQNPAGFFVSGDTWTLQGINFGGQTKNGMEALELIPSGYYPSTWGGNVNLGGIFFAAVQANHDKMYVYTLGTLNFGAVGLTNLDGPSNPLTIPAVASAGTGATPKVSDLCFTGGRLYVLYDGGDDASGQTLTHDFLQRITISTSSSATTTNALRSDGDYQLPWIGCEGLAIDGYDLYIAVDNGSDPSLNGVYVLPGVMKKLTWST